ncbi:penicillin-binding transpeptidase domain-containing protein [Clostridium ihumii]|uniref:penicillin-binding transpeptidase domain-containing protein n=1 Tax=Clostridium ihumii TaxID=1470356 RepID=UPI00058B28B9|nr:penicillin-binding transpeptidase domain-containing protein [Clostridium ihumii]
MRKNRKKIYGRYNWRSVIINRAYGVTIIYTCIFIALVGRLFYIQNYKKDSYQVLANKQYYYEENLSNINYTLLDRNNENLLDIEKEYCIVLDPMTFLHMNEKTDEKDIKKILYIIKDYNNEYDLYKAAYMDKSKKYTYVVDKKTYEKFKESNQVNGIYGYVRDRAIVKKDWKIENLIMSPNLYENGKLKDDGCIERQINEKIKKNKFSKMIFEKNVDGKIIDEKIENSEENINVKLTLDRKIENKINEVLRNDKFKRYSQIGAIITECDTGKILGMCQKDDKISNVNIGVPSSNGFLVGSVFKTIVLEAALDNNVATLNDEFEVKNIFPKSNEHKSKYDLSEAYLYSSNDVFAQLGWKIGLDKMTEYSKEQGLLDKVLNLNDERCGRVENLNDDESVGVTTNMSIGQSIRTTPIAISTLPIAIVNGGIYVKPYILDSYVDTKLNEIEKSNTEKKRVIGEETASLLKKEMQSVIKSTDATGRNANVEGVNMGGKTGTTEYFVDGKEYSDGWFVGFFEKNNKYYSLVVFIPEIDIKEDAGGRTSALVFKEIVQELIKNNNLI